MAKNKWTDPSAGKSSSSSKANMTKAERRDAARVAAKEQREAAQRKAKRNTRIAVISVASLAIGLVAGIGILLAMNQGPQVSASTSDTALEGGIVYSAGGDTKDLVTVNVYSDYMCPFCGEFERSVGPKLREYAEQGKIVIDYHPVPFLDRFSSGTEFSTRGTVAALAIGELEIDKFPKFNELMFKNQPEENSEGLTDEQIRQFAKEAGVSDATIKQFDSQKYKDLSAKAKAQALADGVDGTPTIRIEGKDYKLTDEDIATGVEFKKALDKAIADKAA